MNSLVHRFRRKNSTNWQPDAVANRKHRPARLLLVVALVASVLAVVVSPASAQTRQADIHPHHSSVPGSLVVGQWTDVRIAVENKSDFTWPAGGNHPVRLGAGNGAGTGSSASNTLEWRAKPGSGHDVHYSSPENARVLLNQDVGPGGWANFELQVRANQGAASTQRLQVRMVQEYIEWFGEDYGVSIPLSGGSTGPAPGSNPNNPACEPLSGNRIRVASWDNAFDTCSVPGNPTSVWLIDNESNTRCSQGLNWNFSDYHNQIWVRDGCRAVFGYTSSRCISRSVEEPYNWMWWNIWRYQWETFYTASAQKTTISACTDGSTLYSIQVNDHNCDPKIDHYAVTATKLTPTITGDGQRDGFVTLECEVQVGGWLKIGSRSGSAGFNVGRNHVFVTNYELHVNDQGGIDIKTSSHIHR